MVESSKTIQEEINKHNWYQSIPLADNITTPGETGQSEQKKIEMMQLPNDLSGMTVLDIGCNEGFFSFEAEKRGADRIVATDKGLAAQEKFRLVKRILGSKVEFAAIDLFDMDVAVVGKFDIVLFLAVFHHVRYPMLALDRLYQLTNKFAIMEFVEAVPGIHEGVSALVRKMSKKGHLHILPTRTFILETLTRAGFKKIEILGTHRSHELGPERKMPGFSERRVLLKANR